MKNYLLVNPYIEGSFNKTITAKNSLDAANQIYTSLSEHFSGPISNFKFSILRINKKHVNNQNDYSSYEFKSKKNKHLLHFKVKESIDDNKVNFSIQPYNGKLILLNEFKQSLDNHLNKSQQGGHKDSKFNKSKFDESNDDSSSSDSDSMDYNIKLRKKLTNPIDFLWYNPFIYYTDQVYIPSFISSFPIVLDTYGVVNLVSYTTKPNVVETTHDYRK